jgi:hypothetical protein
MLSPQRLAASLRHSAGTAAGVLLYWLLLLLVVGKCLAGVVAGCC